MDKNNIKEMIEELVEKIQSSQKLMTRFEKEPVKLIEELVGFDLPDAQVQQIVDAVKAKIKVDKLGDALGALGGLFGKK